MKLRTWAGAFALLAVAVSCLVSRPSFYQAVADVALVVSNGGAPAPISTSTPLPALQLQGQGYCQVVIGGSPVGLTAVPQTSGDGGATWQTASSINSGSISAAGTYAGTIVGSGNGLLLFRLNVTAYTSGTTTYVLGCGPQSSGGGGSGGTVAISPLPLPVTVSAQVTFPPAYNTASPSGDLAVVPGGANGSPYPIDTGSRPIVNDNGQTATILTSGSATSCTNIKASATTLFSIQNVGPLMTVYPQFYNDGGTTCAAANLVFGDGSTIVLGPGQVITFRLPLSNGLAYKLSGSLTSNLVVVTY